MPASVFRSEPRVNLTGVPSAAEDLGMRSAEEVRIRKKKLMAAAGGADTMGGAAGALLGYRQAGAPL